MRHRHGVCEGHVSSMPAQKTQERRNAQKACECMHGVGGVHISNILDTHFEWKKKKLDF
jgi:hypothetical protein